MSDEINRLSDIAYGESDQQVLDVYYPAIKQQGAPTVFMVHGGAWRIGDKASKAVIKNKVAHWVPEGFVFISVNYRLLPEIQPVEQAEDIAKALRFAQQHVHKWGGSPDKFILMGHSAGAHLVSLISVRPGAGIQPWLGTVALDSAAYDVETIMRAPSPPRLYKKAFGKNPAYWQQASPMHALTGKLPPFLAVCSVIRKDDPCAQAKRFVVKARAYGSRAELLPVALSHRKINVDLGTDHCYTQAVDTFLSTLDPSIASMLTRASQLPDRAQLSCVGD
ncbi:alpha/beta hydrolase [Pontibacter sp. JAM-7]|uniref:alpha/beta hydrolase n=1 Tax=Pontibacter sp. JAM-7 TaxID=3366581 RepID=UPI003AF6607B